MINEDLTVHFWVYKIMRICELSRVISNKSEKNGRQVEKMRTLFFNSCIFNTHNPLKFMDILYVTYI